MYPVPLAILVLFRTVADDAVATCEGVRIISVSKLSARLKTAEEKLVTLPKSAFTSPSQSWKAEVCILVAL